MNIETKGLKSKAKEFKPKRQAVKDAITIDREIGKEEDEK